MKDFIKILLLSSIMLSFGCGEHEELSDCELAPCDPKKKTVKEVTDQVGRIGYSQNEEKWLIIVSIPHTYDSQDLGIVCGDLPEEFKEEGKQIEFSGEYKMKCDKTIGTLPGQTYYYLHISEINPLK